MTTPAKTTQVPLPTKSAKPPENCTKKTAPAVPEVRPSRTPVVQRKAQSPAPSSIPAGVAKIAQSPGLPLETSTRQFMESGFGRDFGGVRVHTGPDAVQSARELDARAYTFGRNVAFGAGQYRPHTPEGRSLIAHELTHTIQQRGVQRMPTGVDRGPADPLEREADRAAANVMRGRRVSIAGTGESQIARAPWTWHDVVSGPLEKAEVKKLSDPVQDTNTQKSVRAFDMGDFEIPREKGCDDRVLSVYEYGASKGALNFVVDAADITNIKADTLLTQVRDEANLRRYWFDFLGRDEKTVTDEWPNKVREVYKDYYVTNPQTPDMTFPKVPEQSSSCNIDHIVELQAGATNVKENIQVLDDSLNKSAGSQIRWDRVNTANAIRSALDAEGKLCDRYILIYSGAKHKSTGESPTAVSGFTVGRRMETAAQDGTFGTAAGGAGAGLEDFVISAGSQTTLKVPIGTKAGTYTNDILIAEDPLNKNSSWLVPGMILTVLKPGKSPRILAIFDTKSKEKSIPFELLSGKTFEFTVGTDGTLKLLNPPASTQIYYRYLSTGVIKSIKMSPPNGVSGVVTITPSINLIGPIDVAFAPDSLAVQTTIDKKKLKGLPGINITNVALALQLFPEFKPSGTIDLSLGPEAKPFAAGKVTVTTDESFNFLAKGDFNATIPGFQAATLNVAYGKLGDQYAWSGFAELKPATIPSVKSANVRVDLGPDGFVFSGGVTIALPGSESNEVGLQFVYDEKTKSRILTGKGTYKPPIPGLEDVNLDLKYDIGADVLSGSGTAKFVFRGLNGTFHADYKDGKISGWSDVSFVKGKAAGSIRVNVSSQGKFTGKGSLTYQLTPNVLVSGSIELNDKQEIVISGELTYSKAIEFFEPIKGNYTLLSVSQNIPVPGLSIPGVGVQIKLTAELGAGYSIGPAGVKNIRVGGSLKPFDPNPDLGVSAHADFYCGANAYISGTLGGGLALSAFIAEVSGNVGVKATANLSGTANAPVDIKYEKNTFSADIGLKAQMQLAIIMELLAWVTAGVGIGPFKTESKWSWTLASYTYKPAGFQLGIALKKPFHYDSSGGFSIPSASDFDITAPKLDPANIISSLFTNAAKMAPPPAN